MRDPTDPKSGYSRQEIWWDKAHYRPQKIEYYDRKWSHMKTLTFTGYQQYFGKYWRAAEYRMENHQTGKKTRLDWKDYTFGNGYSNADFTQNSLKRAR